MRQRHFLGRQLLEDAQQQHLLIVVRQLRQGVGQLHRGLSLHGVGTG